MAGISSEILCKNCGFPKVLEIGRGVIYSKCLKCGSREFEWAYGDKEVRLNILSALYDIPKKEIKRRL